jgi:hypothetical protein
MSMRALRSGAWLLAGLLGAGVLAGCGQTAQASRARVVAQVAAPSTSKPPTSTPPPSPPPLPGGGTQWFPDHRVVAYYGTAGTASLGVLGAQSPEASAAKVASVANGFASPGTTVVPTFELIATVADGGPGPDGTYSHPISTDQVEQYLKVAQEHHMELILDIQPGRADFLSQVQHWADVLAQPDVGLGLDSEWRMGPGQVPGRSIGHVDAAEVNSVTDWLANLVRQHNLPQKLVVLHQFTASMITDEGAITAHPELAMVQHLDGFGSRSVKLSVYHRLVQPQQFAPGFKLFYKQDTDMMSPTDVLALDPKPDFISYQ